ncbi:MAG TPA: M14 family metallopeptidase [Candidatus Cybelea sp.]|nr:M14 family metallopeptidase [Candidatus Cybelea sp.]
MSALGEMFSADFAEARARFLTAAKAASAEVVTVDNPARGPGGLLLSTDVVRIGPRDATRIVMAVSGTHGVEGFAGSAAQVAWLRGRRSLPDGVAVVLVHAINPFGFAWLRRVSEDNVDVNRNFVDHARSHPANALYDEIAEVMLPARWNENSLAKLRMALEKLVQKHGPGADLRVGSGQYAHPKGLFYGGREPVWSNKTLTAIARKFLAGARHVAYVDFHTGLGPYGHGEAICYHAPRTPAFEAARRWYGAGITSPHAGNSASPMNAGKTGYGVMSSLPKAQVVCVTLEFGTYQGSRVLGAIVADGWLHTFGDLDTDKGRQIKAEMREAFYPDKDDWKDMVARRSDEILRQAVEGVARET